jgi:hypothetical protein
MIVDSVFPRSPPQATKQTPRIVMNRIVVTHDLRVTFTDDRLNAQIQLRRIHNGVAIADGQKTTLSRSGIGQSQRAKSFAMEFLVYVESILPVGIEVGVARRRQMRHIGVIDMLAFCFQLI